MGVANPPYLKQDLENLLQYANRACMAKHPVRIWSVIPASCKECPDLQQRIRHFSGYIVASWPKDSFPFVPLDFWVGKAAYANSKGHRAPMPVDLIVFQNYAAATLFPLQILHLHLLKCWTCMIMGNIGKKTKWDPGYPCGLGTWAAEDLDNWWEQGTSPQQLLDILLPQSQWWQRKCPAPFS